MKALNIFLILFSSLFLFTSCEDENTEKDIVANDYYSKFLTIYEASDSLGTTLTLEAVDEYLSEYPELMDAHLFKGYLLAKEGQLEQANKAFEVAENVDSTDIRVYEYWTAFLLKDSTKADVNFDKLTYASTLEEQSAALQNNIAWHHLIYTQDYPKATKNALSAYRHDSLNYYYSRTCALAYFKQDSLELSQKFMNEAVSLGLKDTSILNQFMNADISALELYTSFK